MRTLTTFVALLLTALVATAATKTDTKTAVAALKLLSRAQAKNLARIEAHEGTPVPERWHLLVYDAEADNGLHEYVVAAGEVVASRNVSQFAESLKAEDVIGADAVKIDSDRAAKVLQEYALANNVTIATITYVLKKEGADAAPLWHVTGIDEAGKEVGSIVLAAGRGTVVAHDGFPVVPVIAQEKDKKPDATKDAFKPQPNTQVASRDDDDQPSEKHGGGSSSSGRRRSGGSSSDDDEHRPGFLLRAGSKIRGFLFGR